MKVAKWLLVLVLAVGAGACTGGGKEWAGDPQLVHQLKLKMTPEDVRRVLGEPSNVTDADMLGQEQEVWVYNGNEPISLVFQNGKLMIATLGSTTIFQAGPGDV